MKIVIKSVAHRDINIAKSATMELNLGTRSIKSKKLYSRKLKHRGNEYV